MSKSQAPPPSVRKSEVKGGGLPAPVPSARRALLWMFLVALLLRLAVAVVMYSDFLDPARNYWHFGWEAGQIATSLYNHQGFSAPFFQSTGSTALLPPVYPWLMMLCMRLFGVHNAGSALAILSLNGLFASLTVLPVYFMARRVFGERTARAAGWTWAFFPFSIYLASGRMWVDTLTCFTACLILLQTLRLADKSAWHDWLLWGGLWGIGALVSPVLLGPLPFLALWLVVRRQRTGSRWFAPALLSALVFMAVIAPWTVRNYRTLHLVMPVRDGFWLGVHEGNCGDTSNLQPDSADPSTSEAEHAQWVRLGEIGYLDAKKAEAKRFIREHSVFTAWVTLRRVIYTWTGFWSLDRAFLADEPFHIPYVAFTTTMSALLLLGLRYAGLSQARALLMPFLLELITFPVIFYVTHPSMDYRHPLDPIIVIFGCYAVVEWLRQRAEGKLLRNSVGSKSAA